MIVFLDSGVLGLISSPNDRSEVTACQNWVFGLLVKGVNKESILLETIQRLPADRSTVSIVKFGF